MIKKLSKRRLTLLIIGIAIVLGASLPPFMTASCLTQQTPAEARALESLRNVTRGGQLPPEDVVAKIESDFRNTKAAGLARIVHARIKLAANDYAGAATLLDSSTIRDYTSLGDYALFMRGQAFEQAGQPADGRRAYEQLLTSYPSSSRAHTGSLRLADLSLKAGNAAAVPAGLQELANKNDAAALLLTAKAYEQSGDTTRALAAYRRLYFFAPASQESVEAATALVRLGSTASPASADEATARADRLYDAKRYLDAFQAYTDAANKFPASVTNQARLRRGIAAASTRKTADAVVALSSVPVSAGDTRAEALSYLAQAYARARQWEQARATIEEMRRLYPKSALTARAMVSVGQIAEDANNPTDAAYFERAAVSSFQGWGEVAQAQFNLAWDAHTAKDYQESSRLLTEHLAYYVDKNNDNRGRAGYWAARDSERAGKLAEARALYEAMQARYDANWYGYLAKQRLDAMGRSASQKSFVPGSLIGRAVANLKTVNVAEETAGTDVEAGIAKADQLANVGLTDWALEELSAASQAAPNSPKVNLAIAQAYRAAGDNVRALNTLRKSFPDYSQMKPEEMTRAEWDIFYPLAYWDIIVQESRARNLDPYQVAGLIRQETIFDARASSPAKAYGLMQLLVPTGITTARKLGVDRAITADSLFEPRLNIQLGTAYMRDQIDRFGKIEYVAAAYNAGPLRVVQWMSSLPPDMDEWAEAVPFKETRGYIQGVIRNRLQYMRLYDQNGRFRPEVGARAVSLQPVNDSSVVRRRESINSNEE